MYLLGTEKAPDHSTIARVRSGRLKDAINELFLQVIELLKESGEISGKNLFIDGTKLLHRQK
jgi:transposase